MPPTRRDGLLLDLDGTLVDTAPDLADALARLLAEEGLPALPEAEVARLVGDGAARLVARALAAHGRPCEGARLDAYVARFLAHYGAAPAARSRPYPGVAATLEALRAAGWRLGVCTNKPQGLSEAVLAGLGLARFIDAVAGGDRFAVRKPDPGHVLATLELLGVAPAAAVMVGDSRNDVAAARAAGVACVAVAYGYSKEPAERLGAARVVASFDELPAALADLAGAAG